MTRARAHRWLRTEEAAAYVMLSKAGFLRRVKVGKLPPPSYALGPHTPRWDREAIDTAMKGATTPAQRPLAGALAAVLAEAAQRKCRGM